MFRISISELNLPTVVRKMGQNMSTMMKKKMRIVKTVSKEKQEMIKNTFISNSNKRNNLNLSQRLNQGGVTFHPLMIG